MFSFQDINIIILFQCTLLLFVIFILIYAKFLRLRVRGRMMNNLANEFNLKYFAEPPSSISAFSVQPKSYDPKYSMNHISGIYKRHGIHIYDFIIPLIETKYSLTGKKFSWFFRDVALRRTYIEIDGKEVYYGNFFFEAFHMAPVYYMRKVLKNLS